VVDVAAAAKAAAGQVVGGRLEEVAGSEQLETIDEARPEIAAYITRWRRRR